VSFCRSFAPPREDRSSRARRVELENANSRLRERETALEAMVAALKGTVAALEAENAALRSALGRPVLVLETFAQPAPRGGFGAALLRWWSGYP
jgi:uncharacterized protein YlxW (UPF0749 family)